MTIQEKCNKLNNDIHNPLFYNNYLLKIPGVYNYEKVFTSLDVIEDCQDAIDEFNKIPEKNIQTRSTLYIYGVLQSIYCQQDGLFNLYNTITEAKFKGVYTLFEKYNYKKESREVRNDIAGHPSNRNNGKEFYFIAKGQNSKYKFSYGGYTPNFRLVNVDLKQFIEEQKSFTETILNDIETHVAKSIVQHKNKYKKIKLVSLADGIQRAIQLISRGIHDKTRCFQAEIGINQFTETLTQLTTELNFRYNNHFSDSISEIFRLQNHSLERIKELFDNDKLLNNQDAEIFLDSLDNQTRELLDILKEIDTEFET